MLETPIGDWRSRGKRRFQLDRVRSICRGRRRSAWAGGALGAGRPAVLIWPFFFFMMILFHEVMRVRGAGARTRSEEKRDFSLRRPTHSQERMRKKKSACFVRNDGARAGRMRKKKSACFVRNDGAGTGRMRKKKSACFVRNDGGGTGRMRKKKSACFVRNDGAGTGRDEEGVRGSG